MSVKRNDASACCFDDRKCPNLPLSSTVIGTGYGDAAITAFGSRCFTVYLFRKVYLGDARIGVGAATHHNQCVGRRPVATKVSPLIHFVHIEISLCNLLQFPYHTAKGSSTPALATL